MKFSRRSTAVSASLAVVVAVLLSAFVVGGARTAVTTPQHTSPQHTSTATAPRAVASGDPTPSATPSPSAAPYSAPTPAEVAALPEAKYNAVIPGLLASVLASVPAEATAVYSIAVDAPLYGADLTTPVGRFAAMNFLKQRSVIVPIRFAGDWALVLTPSRRSLPSHDRDAPAQTAAWMRRDLLTKVQDLSLHVVIAVAAQTVSIVDASGVVIHTFSAGVGARSTRTPTGVTGYIEARYLDPAQNQTVYPIGLTSMHSSDSDEPFGGDDGGLIGIHYEATHSGSVSHGCVRLSGPDITIFDRLPLGTPIVMVD